MRDIDDARDAEDQRQAGSDQKQAGGAGEPVERLEEEGVEGHGLLTSPRLRGEVDFRAEARKSGEGASPSITVKAPSPGSDRRSSPPSPREQGEGKRRPSPLLIRVRRTQLLHFGVAREHGSAIDIFEVDHG